TPAQTGLLHGVAGWRAAARRVGLRGIHALQGFGWHRTAAEDLLPHDRLQGVNLFSAHSIEQRLHLPGDRFTQEDRPPVGADDEPGLVVIERVGDTVDLDAGIRVDRDPRALPD